MHLFFIVTPVPTIIIIIVFTDTTMNDLMTLSTFTFLHTSDNDSKELIYSLLVVTSQIALNGSIICRACLSRGTRGRVRLI